MEFEHGFAQIVDWIDGYCPLRHLSSLDFLDYQNNALRETIDGLLHDRLISWTRSGECAWVKDSDVHDPPIASLQP